MSDREYIRRIGWMPLSMQYDPNAKPGEGSDAGSDDAGDQAPSADAGADAGADDGAAASDDARAGDAASSSDGDDAESLDALKAQNARLKERLRKRDEKRDKADEQQLAEDRRFKELATKRQARIDQLEAENRQEKNRNRILRMSDLQYPAEAIIDFIGSDDLGAEDADVKALAKEASARLKSLGLAPVDAKVASLGDPPPGDRTPDSHSTKLEAYKDAWKKGDNRRFLQLQQELQQAGVKLPFLN